VPLPAAGETGTRAAVQKKPTCRLSRWRSSITLAALVPVLRRFGAEIPRTAARRFNQVAWPALAALFLGILLAG